MADVLTDLDIDCCVKAAAGLALFFVGESEENMLAAMPELRAKLEANFALYVDGDIAALIAQAMVAAVVGRKREIEAAGQPPRVLT